VGCSPCHIISLGYSPPSRCSKCNARVMTARSPMAMPEELQADRVRLRRHRVSDASGIAEAVTASVEELRRWMPWPTEESTDPDFQRQRLEAAVDLWEQGSDFSYVVVDDQERILGVMSLMARVGPRALEIGYWLRSDRTGRGIATSCVAALTKCALAGSGVDRVEIHCDEANIRSAAIPKRLGYRLDRIEDDEVAAPGEIGRSMVWIFPPDEQSATKPCWGQQDDA
jgi:RimJ/RimL family protein N-acetyltransferase